MDFEKHRRGARHRFATAIEVTDVLSEKQVVARTRDLSLFGCFAQTATPFPPGTSVGLIIRHGAAKILAHGRIAYVRDGEGMGIAFSKIEPSDQAVLDQWLDEMRDK
jgi:hypothetical protein